MIPRIYHIIVPLCGETMVIGGFPLQRESNADLWCLNLTNKLYDPAMAYFSEVVSYWLPVEI